jgi:hypothetical protein
MYRPIGDIMATSSANAPILRIRFCRPVLSVCLRVQGATRNAEDTHTHTHTSALSRTRGDDERARKTGREKGVAGRETPAGTRSSARAGVREGSVLQRDAVGMYQSREKSESETRDLDRE